MCVPGARKGQKRMLDTLELELQKVVDLGVESWSFGRLASALDWLRGIVQSVL